MWERGQEEEIGERGKGEPYDKGGIDREENRRKRKKIVCRNARQAEKEEGRRRK